MSPNSSGRSHPFSEIERNQRLQLVMAALEAVGIGSPEGLEPKLPMNRKRQRSGVTLQISEKPSRTARGLKIRFTCDKIPGQPVLTLQWTPGSDCWSYTLAATNVNDPSEIRSGDWHVLRPFSHNRRNPQQCELSDIQVVRLLGRVARYMTS